MLSSASKASANSESRTFGAILRCGASVAAICAMATAMPAYAQTGSASGQGTAGSNTGAGTGGESGVANTTDADQSGGGQEIVVTGIRQSLANSQNIKRNSDTVVDAITATDIGALPDRSVTEALQRVPGVAMNRFAGSNDPDHFSVEGSGVVVRGLNFVRSEFNGRDTFSTGVGGQSINFSDVPAELLGSVEVYKNTTAEMIEGGLAGTVNLNTRLPFDNKGFHVGFDMEASYGDMRKKWSPVGSLLISDTWDTGIGRIGLLADISYSQVLSRADGMQVSNVQTRDNSWVQLAFSTSFVCRNQLPDTVDNTGDQPNVCGQSPTGGPNGNLDPASIRYAPIGASFRSQNFNRERTGIAAAFQWESLDRRTQLTAQFLRTDSTNKWGEHTFEGEGDLQDYNTYPVGCRPNQGGPNQIVAGDLIPGDLPVLGQSTGSGGATVRAECPTGSTANYQYNSDGVFESGYVTYPGTGWRSQDSGGTWRTPTGGMQQILSRRQVDEENIVSDYGLNLKFNPNEHWAINLDGQYVKAKHTQLDMSIQGSTFADNELDLTGQYPQSTLHKPLWLSATWSGATSPGGGSATDPAGSACANSTVPVQGGGTRVAGQCSPYGPLNRATDGTYFTDPQFTFWRSAMDHIEDSDGHEWAFKGDVAYNFDPGSFLKRIKFGARYADRNQTVRYTTYNWNVLSETWGGIGPVWMDQAGGSGAGIYPGNIQFFSFPNFFRGSTNSPPGGFYYAPDLIQGYGAVTQFARAVNTRSTLNGWVPLASRAGVVPGTPFLPNEIQPVDQRTKNAYLMLSFGSSEPIFGNIRLDGNIGVRYMADSVKSTGSVAFPLIGSGVPSEPFLTIPGVPPAPPTPGHCDLRPPPIAAPPGPPTSPGGICLLGPQGYADAQQFAVHPGDVAVNPSVIRNKYHYFLPSLNLKFGVTPDVVVRFAASRVLARPDLANIRNYTNIFLSGASFTANAGNPNLKPALADQFDLTAEWYFARVGSLTVDAFYKRIKNFFYSQTRHLSYTNNGITEDVAVNGPANFHGWGKVKGVEVAYQQTFDFLPSVFSGLGVNASYTYLQSQGIPNALLNTGAVVSSSPIGPPSGNLPLEQLSKHNINVTGFYEKGPISFRLSYNWRSKFLLTASDVIFPFFPIYNAAEGYLDGSLFINVNKQVKVGVQAANILNTVTRTLQQYTQDGRSAPRSYFMNDRRYSFIIRGQF